MSEQNVELARRAMEAFNARDFEALIALNDPNVEYRPVLSAIGGEPSTVGTMGYGAGLDNWMTHGRSFASSPRPTSISVSRRSCSPFSVGADGIAVLRWRCRGPRWRGGATASASTPRRTPTERMR